MGGPTSAIVSEIYMQVLEMTAITTADHPPKIWERHVDESSLLYSKFTFKNHYTTSTACTHKHNSQNKKNKIPLLPFLDNLVQRNPDKTISVKVCRKPTHTNQYLNYASHHSTSAKQSVITALFDRADNVVSSEKDKEEEKQHILAALQQNGYPRDFIMKTVKQCNRRKEQATEVTEEESKPKKKSTSPTSKEQVKNLEELSISTTSKLHSTHLPPLEVFYQSQKFTKEEELLEKQYRTYSRL